MWEKWVFLASLAGITCLTRSAVGDVVAAGGADLAAALLEECRSVAAAAGYPPRPESLQAALGRLTDAGSAVTASMLGDVERRGRTEADHILGDLLRRRGGAVGRGPLAAPGGLHRRQGRGGPGGARAGGEGAVTWIGLPRACGRSPGFSPSIVHRLLRPVRGGGQARLARRPGGMARRSSEGAP